MESYIIFFIITGVIWYWWNSVTAYEIAYRAAKNGCLKLDLQFLDDTLDTVKIRPCRHPRGFVQLCRIYEFEFSSDGDNRYKGYVSLDGAQLKNIDMGAYTTG